MMKKVLLSAFACQPKKGSESSNGWNWATGLANKGYEVHCLTIKNNQPFIEEVEAPANVHFHYVQLPLKLYFLHHFSQPTLYMHYVMWQWLAYKAAKKLHKTQKFDLAHHISWGSPQMGSFLYKLGIPFIFGPAGGGQKAPETFKKYFLGHWASEVKRDKVSDWLVKKNPACKKMVRGAHAVIVSNRETEEFIKAIGAKNVSLSIDHALPDSFFPEKFEAKSPAPGTLKMLWVGRFMPRKGLLLTLDVMARLKANPNITLTIVGDGEMKEEIIKKIKQEGLEETVKLTGTIPYEQVKEYYSAYDIFFFTSLRDSCPAQLSEAMAFGMPVVTLNLHGQGFVINDETGIRCECDTPEKTINELEKAITGLYNNPQIVTKMSQAAYDFAKKQTWKARIDTLVGRHYPV